MGNDSGHLIEKRILDFKEKLPQKYRDEFEDIMDEYNRIIVSAISSFNANEPEYEGDGSSDSEHEDVHPVIPMFEWRKNQSAQKNMLTEYLEDIEIDLDEEELATLNIEGKRVNLSSFIISGESDEGERMVFTYRCAPDEMLMYLKTLEVLVNEKFKNLLEIGD